MVSKTRYAIPINVTNREVQRTTHVVINGEPTIQGFFRGGMCSQHFPAGIDGKSWS